MVIQNEKDQRERENVHKQVEVAPIQVNLGNDNLGGLEVSYLDLETSCSLEICDINITREEMEIQIKTNPVEVAKNLVASIFQQMQQQTIWNSDKDSWKAPLLYNLLKMKCIKRQIIVKRKSIK